MTAVKELFQIPKQIRKGDFVVRLTEGIRDAETTASTYVVTPALADAFDRALGLVGSALRDGRSQAAYLHGSFGCGKSHFMALLSLLMQGAEPAWRIPELHPLRQKHEFVGSSRLLELHFHMVGQDNIESAVFAGYLAHVKEHHPDAPIPALFADEELFVNAAQMLENVGEEAFFARMNDALPEAEGWGDLAADRWERARFDEAVKSSDLELRAKLFDALVRAWFSSFAAAKHEYIDLDSGLGVMSKHAKSLGYDGIVLFLDELILWLASQASRRAWLHTEAQKMVKLVEAQEANRPIPIVSFIARQRDLAEMVGEDYAGAENALLRESLDWWEGRYDKIVLEDKNLPAIVEKRVLRPKDDAARAELAGAFDKLRKAMGPAWQTMLGQGDGEAFRKLYPFSPALVDGLVALSNSLQRERTAIKLLNEMLVEHIDDLSLGEVVRVGDLYDLLAGGEDSADGVMRARFDSAKQLYDAKLLPLIRERCQTAVPERCRRLRQDHPARLGCAGCPESACRAENRMAKTLIIAALVPQVPVLREMTAGRLAQLNHGSLKSPIPGAEAGQVASRLREWSSRIHHLTVGHGSNPTVTLQLEGVDIEPIMQQARDRDTPGARLRIVRDLLFDAMGMDSGESAFETAVDWRCTKRRGAVRFGNVRQMRHEQLLCPGDNDWQIVVDYPFDDPGFGPSDDLEVVEKLIESRSGSWTLVWLPSFFAEGINKQLGDLVVLEHILESRQTTTGYLCQLSLEDQSLALTQLTNLKNSKRVQIHRAIKQAYGLEISSDTAIDTSRSIDQNLYLLQPGVSFQARLPANLSEAVEFYARAVLDARYPRHPVFLKAPGQRKRAERLLALFAEIVEAGDAGLALDKDALGELRATLEPLGLVRLTETNAFVLEDNRLASLEQKRIQAAKDSPTAGELRRWINDRGLEGLQSDVEDIIIRAYARRYARAFTVFDSEYDATGKGRIPDEVVLVKPELPSNAQWNTALTKLGDILGVTLPGKALHAQNMQKLATKLEQARQSKTEPCQRIPGLLEGFFRDFDINEDADRMQTARSARAFFALLAGKRPVDMLRAVADFEPKTSARALGAAVAAAERTCECLGDDLVRKPLAQLADIRGQDRARAVFDEVAAVLRQDELNRPLCGELRNLAGRAVDIWPPPPPPPPPPPKWQKRIVREVRPEDSSEALAQLDDVVATVREALKEFEGPVELEASFSLRTKG